MDPRFKRFLAWIVTLIIFDLILNNQHVMTDFASMLNEHIENSGISNRIPTSIMAATPYIIEFIIGKLR